MYCFGKINHDQLNVENSALVLQRARAELMELQKRSIDSILNLLDSFGKTWIAGTENYNEALNGLINEVSFSEEMLKASLDIIPKLLSRSSMEVRIRAEIGELTVLDGYVARDQFSGRIYAKPQGIILHVTAGNVFLGCIDSLLMGFLTKNVSIVKLSSKNQFFPMFFAQKLLEFDKAGILSRSFSLLHWKGGDKRIENYFKENVNVIMAWGGEEMLQSYYEDKPVNVKLLDFGPKISFDVVTKAYYEQNNLNEIAAKIVEDISLWDQQACASPQNLFIQDGIDEKEISLAIASELDKFPLKRGKIDNDEAVEILKEWQRSLYSEFEGGLSLQTASGLIHVDHHPYLRPSPLNRSLIIKRFKTIDELSVELKSFSFYLQSCGYGFAPSEIEDALLKLSQVGIKRFAPVGTIMHGMDGAPHDGRFVLKELVEFIGDEKRDDLLGKIHAVPYYSKYKIKSFADFPLVDGKILAAHFQHFINPNIEDGYVFSSGGTTGAPKYSYYSTRDFKISAQMIAHCLKAQGVKKGEKVANLFMAGNMWSSFLAVDKALEQLQTKQFPLAGNASVEYILKICQDFKIETILGIPTFLLDLAREAQTKNLNLKISKIFFAGEHLTTHQRDFLKQVFNCDYIGSAGYASVDAGPIGYECNQCAPGVFHLFDQIKLEVIDGEGVVTSLFREAMPIIRYKTGDAIELLSQKCACGSSDQLFRLKGRTDSQINIWGCRLFLEDFEKGLADALPTLLHFKMILSHEHNEEKMELMLEASQSNSLQIVEKLYQHLSDLNKTHSIEYFQSKLTITFHEKLERQERTGKLSLVKDNRKFS